jgi:hypothetical protein
MKRTWAVLALAVACLGASCASSRRPGGACTVPASICQARPPTPEPGSPRTCGLCQEERLTRWIEEKGCLYGPNLLCAGGQIYGYGGRRLCCQDPPYGSGPAPASPGAALPGAEESLASIPRGAGGRGGQGPEAAGGCPAGCSTPPPGCRIKGNINRKGKGRVYHLPGQKHYDEVTIEPEAGERWFCSEDEALANGWRKSKP